MTAQTISNPNKSDPNSSARANSASKPLRIGLWVAQALAGAVFCFAGFTKLTTPIPALAHMMPWAGTVSEAFVRFIAGVDLAGGLGLILPALTRIQPRLTVLAALGCVVLQILAAAYHVSRGEYAVLPLNAVLLALSAFIFLGRRGPAPIAPRD